MCAMLEMPVGCDTLNSSSIPTGDLITEMTKYSIYYAGMLSMMFNDSN